MARNETAQAENEAAGKGEGEDDEWQRELLEDLDYELVEKTAAGRNDEQWEKEIDELLESCSDN